MGFLFKSFIVMLDETMWLEFSSAEKLKELKSCLDAILTIENGSHELSGSPQQGRLAGIKKDFSDRVFKIMELESTI